MPRETEVTELTGSHRETEKRRLTESGARQRAGAAGPARKDKKAGQYKRWPLVVCISGLLILA